MKITKRQLRRLIREERQKLIQEVDWFKLHDETEELKDYQKEALKNLELEVEHCLSVGLTPEIIRNTVLARTG